MTAEFSPVGSARLLALSLLALLAPTHFLATCLAMDLVFVRRNSAPAARWPSWKAARC